MFAITLLEAIGILDGNGDHWIQNTWDGSDEECLVGATNAAEGTADLGSTGRPESTSPEKLDTRIALRSVSDVLETIGIASERIVISDGDELLHVADIAQHLDLLVRREEDCLEFLLLESLPLADPIPAEWGAPCAEHWRESGFEVGFDCTGRWGVGFSAPAKACEDPRYVGWWLEDLMPTFTVSRMCAALIVWGDLDPSDALAWTREHEDWCDQNEQILHDFWLATC